MLVAEFGSQTGILVRTGHLLDCHRGSSLAEGPSLGDGSASRWRQLWLLLAWLLLAWLLLALKGSISCCVGQSTV